jgi:pantoate--beta-alanine ligase
MTPLSPKLAAWPGKADMELVTSIAEARQRLDEAREEGGTVGLVPTMGSLHEGHASLMTSAVADNDFTMVTIFVNPLQFAAGEDLESYPRDLDRDLAICAAEGVDLVLAPSVDEMYPTSIETTVTVDAVARPLEGGSRPEHFAGVATVVAKLFSIAGSCRAYFGAKDWQQVAVVRKMAHDLSMPVEVVSCPIVREHDGLAMSSRNVYLSHDERAQAPALRRALDAGLAAIAGGERDPTAVEAAMAAVIADAPLATLDYVAAVQADTLMGDTSLHDEVRLLLAAHFGGTRLIDNDGYMIG